MNKTMKNKLFSMILCSVLAASSMPLGVQGEEFISENPAYEGSGAEMVQADAAEAVPETPAVTENEMELPDAAAEISDAAVEVPEIASGEPETDLVTQEEFVASDDADEGLFFSESETTESDAAEEAQYFDTGHATEGTCGLNGADVRWKLVDGIMTISGSGAMDDYIIIQDLDTGEVTGQNPPWESFRREIQEVVIEEGITSIGYAAFANCYQLQKVTIASSVKKIRSDAFANCIGLSDINMGSGVEELELDVFYGAAVKSLTLSKNLKNIDRFSLVGLWSVENIYVESGSSFYSSRDGVLYTKDEKTLVLYPMNRQGGYLVPEGTVKIADNAFTQSAITSIGLPDSVTEIGEFAFDQCEKLTELVFPKNLKVINRYVCSGDTALISVTIPEGVTQIKEDAFSDCTSLKTVTLPSTIKSIDNAFPSYTEIIFTGNGIYRQEDGSFIDAVKVNVSAREEYKKAFEVLDIVNQERAKEGRAPLTMEASLLETAMMRASETVLYWSHTRPTGSSCFTANSLMFGENIAWGSSTAAGVMNMWMNSSGHKANILGSGYTSIGIGCVKFGNTYYWVQCFGIETGTAVNASSYSDRDVNRSIAVAKDPEYYSAGLQISSTALTVGDTATANITWDGEVLKNSGAVIESSNPDVCKVKNGRITALAAGKATIKAYFPGYEEKTMTQAVTVTAGKTKTIKVTYNANGGTVKTKSKKVTVGKTYGTLASPTRKGYSFAGWYTKKTKGTKVTSSTNVTGTQNVTLYAHWKKVSVSRVSLSSLTNISGRKMAVSFKKVSGAKGYQILYATNSKFTKGKKNVSTKLTSKTLTKLKKGTTYYVKVRAYKTDSAGNKVYGSYSKAKKLKIRK